jgi:hypothetical protein
LKIQGFTKPVNFTSTLHGQPRTIDDARQIQLQNSFQLSMVGKKMGENFLKVSKQGFDFTGSLLLRNVGVVRCFIAGDFTVNMTGINAWQNLPW